MAYKNQVLSMFNWKFSDPLTEKVTVSNAFPVIVGSSENSDLLLGQTYRTGAVLALNYDLRGEQLFGEIVHMVPNCEKEEVLRIETVKYFDGHLV